MLKSAAYVPSTVNSIPDAPVALLLSALRLIFPWLNWIKHSELLELVSTPLSTKLEDVASKVAPS